MIPDCARIAELLQNWLASRLEAPAATWLRERLTAVQTGDKKSLQLAFGLTPRKVGKADLALTEVELSAASAIRPGWDPRGWSVDQVVRTLLVLSVPAHSPEGLVSILDGLFGTGDVGELVALYQALPLLPHPTAHVLRAAEGIRTNIKAVFCAVAHRNPYPSEQFSDDQWNQMVLKCQFIGVPMAPIMGLDQRANAPLASMVRDFIQERRAAKRAIPPDMWRCVGRFADVEALADLKQLLTSGSTVEQQAAALALSENPTTAAKEILDESPDLAKAVASAKICWDSVSELSESSS
ncbi:EboA domain-containing protein [Schlesneria paludicola]|uniref:EboA domain-containing protein n=1 Tax=Schlesneria paludicola TaxID=360056 RepID=UPI00029A4C97|nr:EboA domain-containing protein [Schlesneria paludicola]